MDTCKAFTHNSYFKHKTLNLNTKSEGRNLQCQNSFTDACMPRHGLL